MTSESAFTETPAEPAKKPFQFGIMSLLKLTLIVAMVLSTITTVGWDVTVRLFLALPYIALGCLPFFLHLAVLIGGVLVFCRKWYTLGLAMLIFGLVWPFILY